MESEFTNFLLYTTIPAFGIIAIVTSALTFYAHVAISKRINNLTAMVDNPVKFKNLENNEKKDPDEIQKLVNIFQKFYTVENKN
jgi:hypothetical protein